MCNCGHDVGEQDEVKKLNKRIAITALMAAIFAGFPALFASPEQRNHMILFAVVMEIALLVKGMMLLRHRRQLLACEGL
jgi:hypothetical protein